MEVFGWMCLGFVLIGISLLVIMAIVMRFCPIPDRYEYQASADTLVAAAVDILGGPPTSKELSDIAAEFLKGQWQKEQTTRNAIQETIAAMSDVICERGSVNG